MENHNSLLTDADLKKIVDYSKSQIHCQVIFIILYYLLKFVFNFYCFLGLNMESSKAF